MAEDNKLQIKSKKGNISPDLVYILGFFGSLIYYFVHATTFYMAFIGFLKSLAWPAFLVYKVFEILRM